MGCYSVFSEASGDCFTATKLIVDRSVKMANSKNGEVTTTIEQESTFKGESKGGKGIFENAEGHITNAYVEAKVAKQFGLQSWSDAQGMKLKITLTLSK